MRRMKSSYDDLTMEEKTQKVLEGVEFTLYFQGKVSNYSHDLRMLKKIDLTSSARELKMNKDDLSSGKYTTQNAAKVYLDKYLEKDEYLGDMVIECKWTVKRTGRVVLNDWEIAPPTKMFGNIKEKARKIQWGI